MNERIKELLEQAGVKYVKMPNDTVYAKFAELLIHECARVVDNLTEQDNPIEYRRTYAQGADVLEHFGVKE